MNNTELVKYLFWTVKNNPAQLESSNLLDQVAERIGWPEVTRIVERALEARNQTACATPAPAVSKRITTAV